MNSVAFIIFLVINLLVVSTTARYGVSASPRQYPHTRKNLLGKKRSIFKNFKFPGFGTSQHSTKKPFHLFMVGGRDAIPQEIPYILRLDYNGVFECGASYVKDRIYQVHFAITAAHCIKQLPRMTVTAGIVSNSRSKNTSQTLRVQVVFMHPDYNRNAVGVPVNDIAILVLRGRFLENEYVQPISLPRFGTIHRYTLQASGWGKLNEVDAWNGPVDKLQVADIPVMGNIECNYMYKRTFHTNLKIILPTQICAGYPGGGMDACNGDSGGPLARKWDASTGGAVLVGVTSFGVGCGKPNIPGVYTRVSSYLAWITDTARQIMTMKKWRG